MKDGALVAQPLDLERLELQGSAIPVAAQIELGGRNGRIGGFSASQTGVLAYQGIWTQVQSELAWFDRVGRRVGSVGGPGGYGNVALSPDGKQLATSVADPTRATSDVWLYDLSRDVPTRLTSHPNDDRHPIWSPDGSQIVFTSARTGTADLYQTASGGAGSQDLLLGDTLGKSPSGWSRDGRLIVFHAPGRGMRSDLWLFPLFGDRKPFVFLQTPFSEAWGQVSPDGRWIAYQSDESGKTEIYVTSFPRAGARSRLSSAGGAFPRWQQDGRTLFYLAPDKKLMAVAVNVHAGALDVGAVQPLFETHAMIEGDYNPTIVPGFPYDVSADGQRFLINTALQQTASAPPITLVVNWTAGLKK